MSNGDYDFLFSNPHQFALKHIFPIYIDKMNNQSDTMTTTISCTGIIDGMNKVKDFLQSKHKNHDKEIEQLVKTSRKS